MTRHWQRVLWVFGVLSFGAMSFWALIEFLTYVSRRAL